MHNIIILRREKFGWLLFNKKTQQTRLFRNKDIAINSVKYYDPKILSSNDYDLPTLSAPLKLFIEITNECNLFCTFCSNNSGKNDIISLKTSQIEMILASANEMGIFEVGIIGGEPLCHPCFFEIIRIIKRYGFPISLNTNGLYDANKLHSLSKSGINKIKVSIDGLEECHERIRGVGTFKRIISNVKYLKSQENDVQINLTVNTDNEKDIEEMIKLSDKLNCPLKIAPMLLIGRAKNLLDRVITRDDWKLIYKRISAFIDDFKPKIKVEFASGFITDSCKEVISRYCFLYAKCGLRGSFLSVNCRGEVFNTGKQTEFDYKHYVGNISDLSLQEIWSYTDKKNSEYFNKCSKCKHIDVLISDSFTKG